MFSPQHDHSHPNTNPRPPAQPIIVLNPALPPTAPVTTGGVFHQHPFVFFGNRPVGQAPVFQANPTVTSQFGGGHVHPFR